jgi:hypothetical protein
MHLHSLWGDLTNSSSLDGFWLSYFVMALCGVFSIITFVATANAVADRHSSASRQDQVGLSQEAEDDHASHSTRSKSKSISSKVRHFIK